MGEKENIFWESLFCSLLIEGGRKVNFRWNQRVTAGREYAREVPRQRDCFSLFTFHCFSLRGENTQEKFFVRETAFKRGQFCRFSCPTILKSKCLNMSKLINQPPPPTHCTIQNNVRENNYKSCKNLFILREQLQEQALPKSWHLQNWRFNLSLFYRCVPFKRRKMAKDTVPGWNHKEGSVLKKRSCYIKLGSRLEKEVKKQMWISRNGQRGLCDMSAKYESSRKVA